MYVNYHSSPDFAFYFVLLNGIIQANCIEADDKKGFVTRKTEKGIETKVGKVEIISIERLDKNKKYEVHI